MPEEMIREYIRARLASNRDDQICGFENLSSSPYTVMHNIISETLETQLMEQFGTIPGRALARFLVRSGGLYLTTRSRQQTFSGGE